MTRLALILAAPGGREYSRRPDYLEGIKNDIENWKSFLGSNIGGAWEDSELVVLEDPTKANLATLKEKVRDVDYVFSVFSGHGAFDSSVQKNVYVVKDGLVSENAFDLQVIRQVLIFDACREEQPGILLTEDAMTREFLKAFSDSESREMYRRAFNQAVLASAPGKDHLYSCAEGELAGDIGKGGLFTLKLINSAKTLARQNRGITSIGEAFQLAAREVTKENEQQHPACLVQRRLNPMPLALSLKLG